MHSESSSYPSRDPARTHARSPRWMAVAAVLAGACGSSSPPRPPTTSCGDVENVWVSDSRYCVSVWAPDLGHPRQMAFAPNGDLFVNNGAVMVLHDDDGSGTNADGERSKFATAPDLNHGIAFSPDFAYLYASSATTVYRWQYTTGARKATGPAEVVVSNIPGGGHVTRTLVFDSKGRLYVSVGSASNVDPPELADTRALIRRFTIPESVPAGGLAYPSGETFASGMRNEVGLYMDARDRIWSVENGRDMLTSNGDIHNENPAEEVNLIDGTGATFFGYPKCFSEFNRTGGMGPGTQWADIELPPADRTTDAWCRDPAQVRAPRGAMPAHWAPLGILEYQGSAFPWGHDLIVTAHGSWNSDKPVGRLLARLHRSGDTITSVEPIIGERGPDGALRQGQWDARPVDVREAADGALYFSDDQGGRIFKVTYAAN
jgi:glucose/arabinose dehydrogenase